MMNNGRGGALLYVNAHTHAYLQVTHPQAWQGSSHLILVCCFVGLLVACSRWMLCVCVAGWCVSRCPCHKIPQMHVHTTSSVHTCAMSESTWCSKVQASVSLGRHGDPHGGRSRTSKPTRQLNVNNLSSTVNAIRVYARALCHTDSIHGLLTLTD